MSAFLPSPCFLLSNSSFGSYNGKMKNICKKFHWNHQFAKDWYVCFTRKHLLCSMFPLLHEKKMESSVLIESKVEMVLIVPLPSSSSSFPSEVLIALLWFYTFSSFPVEFALCWTHKKGVEGWILVFVCWFFPWFSSANFSLALLFAQTMQVKKWYT